MPAQSVQPMHVSTIFSDSLGIKKKKNVYYDRSFRERLAATQAAAKHSVTHHPAGHCCEQLPQKATKQSNKFPLGSVIKHLNKKKVNPPPPVMLYVPLQKLSALPHEKRTQTGVYLERGG